MSLTYHTVLYVIGMQIRRSGAATNRRRRQEANLRVPRGRHCPA